MKRDTFPFQFENGLIYSGASDGVTFKGLEIIYLSKEQYDLIQYHIKIGFGVQPVSEETKQRMSAARWSPHNAAYTVWGIKIVPIRSFGLVEFRDNTPARSPEEYERHLLNGNYIDIVLNPERDLIVGSTEELSDGRVKVFHGATANLDEVSKWVDAFGFSGRPSRDAGVMDPEIVGSSTYARRYKHEQYTSKSLMEMVAPDEIEKVSDLDNNEIRDWAQRRLAQAAKKNPHIYWVEGVTELIALVKQHQAEVAAA